MLASTRPLPQTSCEFLEMCIHFGAVKVVHSKSSDKRESSLTLRVAVNKSYITQIGLRYIGGYNATYSERVDSSMEWVMNILMSY